MLVVGLTEVAAACTFVLRNALSCRKPSVSRVDISFVMDDLVDLCGDMVGILGRETAYDDIVVVVIANQLSEKLVGATGIASSSGEITLHLCVVTHEQDVADVGVSVVLALDVGFDGITGKTGNGGAHHCNGSANLLFPVDERLHGIHESIVADDEQFASLVDGVVFAQAFAVVDEMVLVQGTKFGIHPHLRGMAAEGVFAELAIAVHLNGHVVIHAQGMCYRVEGEGIEHHVLSTEVTQDVRIVESYILSGEEGVCRIGLAVCIRHLVGIDTTREIAF